MRSPKASLDFIEEMHRRDETIREAPDRWPSGKNNTRRFLLWRFPFAIIYSEQESVVTIWTVGPRQSTTGVLGGSPVTRRRGIPLIEKYAGTRTVGLLPMGRTNAPGRTGCLAGV